MALLRYFGCQTEAAQGKIFDQEQIATAVELGLGVDSPQKIEFLTPDPASAVYSDQIKQYCSPDNRRCNALLTSALHLHKAIISTLTKHLPCVNRLGIDLFL